MENIIGKYENFDLAELTDGVYSAISTAGSEAFSNAGIVDLGDRILLFDSFLSPNAAIELKEAVKNHIGKPIRYVVNSHYHIDHTGGNLVFAENTDLISSVITRDSMLGRNVDMVKYYRENGADMRVHFQKLLAKEGNSKAAEQIKEQLLYIDILTHNKFYLDLPNIFFSDKLNITGSKNQIELFNYYNGHTECDTILYIPNKRILFSGDLVFVDRHPWLGSGNPFNLIQILENLKAIDFEILITGHGNIGCKKDTDLNLRYIKKVEELAKEVVRRNKDIEEINEDCLNEPYKSWKGGKFIRNINFLIENYRDYLSK
jgi:glyoxylase-like metal-dependent hydrolase (beta-lactamase superfamily II)